MIANLIGQKFNYLTVINGPIKKGRKIYWECQCDCGNFKIARSDQLKNGQTKSCGCYKNKIFIENNKKRQTLDLTNKKFGRLTALYPTETRSADGRVIWQCKCECGREITVDTHGLQQNRILSCGCLKSRGELEIENILLKNNIQFEKQKKFNTCRFPDSNYLASFDFFIFNTYLIEFDGEQHFYYDKNRNSWNTKENFERTQIRDNYKNQWCKENNIPLIRIPYTKLDTLSLEDLMLETSKFKIS